MKKIFLRLASRPPSVVRCVSAGLLLAALPVAGIQAAGSPAHPVAVQVAEHTAQAEGVASTASAALAEGGQGGATPSGAAQAAQPVWIDVRTPREFSTGHLEGAHNVPVEQIAGQITALVPDKDTPVLLYCRSGRRAEQARKLLLQQGYTHVENRGGYAELLKQQQQQQQQPR